MIKWVLIGVLWLTLVVVSCGVPDRDETVITLPCLEDDYPIIEVRVNGVLRRMLVDTGVPVVTMSSTLLGVRDNRWTYVDLVFGERLVIEHVKTWAQDTPFSGPAPDGINGIIGVNVLAFVRPTFDHMQSVIFNTPYHESHCDSYPIRSDLNGLPWVALAAVDEIMLSDVLLDTGAKYCVLNAKTSRGLGSYFYDQAEPTSVTTIHGHRPSGAYLSQVSRYCVMQTCENQVMIHYPKWNVVGDSFFARFRVTFDFVKQTVAFCRE